MIEEAVESGKRDMTPSATRVPQEDPMAPPDTDRRDSAEGESRPPRSRPRRSSTAECARCGSDLFALWLYCPECGQKAAERCARCSTSVPVPLGARHCPSCGESMERPWSSGPLRGESRERPRAPAPPRSDPRDRPPSGRPSRPQSDFRPARPGSRGPSRPTPFAAGRRPPPRPGGRPSGPGGRPSGPGRGGRQGPGGGPPRRSNRRP